MPNESSLACQSVHISYCKVAPDDSDEDEENDIDRTNLQYKAEDNDKDIYSGIDGATVSEALENKIGHFLHLYIHQLTIEFFTSSLPILMMKYQICATSHL